MRKMLLALSGVATLALFGASQSLAAPGKWVIDCCWIKWDRQYRKRSGLLLQ